MSWLHQQKGEQPKSATQVVGDVLEKNMKKNQLLQNVGIQLAKPSSRVEKVETHNCKLRRQKPENVELLLIVNTQLAKIDDMSWKQAYMDAKLELLLGQSSRPT